MKSLKQVGIAVLCVLLSSCGNHGESNESTPVKVKVQSVSTADTKCKRNFSGTVEAGNESAISFSVSGTISRIYAEVGQRVEKGKLLAEIDDTSIRSSYEAAHATLLQARDAYDRMKKLHEQGSLPDIQWVEAESKLQQAESLERIARKNLDDCRLVAPFSGVISMRAAEEGQNAVAGMAVFKLASIDKVKVKIAVPENEIASIKTGKEATICVPALGDTLFTGSISEKGVVANPLSHTYEVKLSLPNPGQNLLPGMVARVTLAGEGLSAYVLPAGAVLLGADNTSFVWVNENGVASRRPVICGRPVADGVTVVSGLNDGDEVLVEGQHKISEGMSIEIVRQ